MKSRRVTHKTIIACSYRMFGLYRCYGRNLKLETTYSVTAVVLSENKIRP